VEARFVTLVNCQDCNVEFQATRSDAKRCKVCKLIYRRERDSAPERRARRVARHKEIRQQAFNGYGGKCSCCDEEKFEFLAIDHVHGNGRKEREKLLTRQIADKVIKNNFPDSYRVLCHNCNQSLGWFGYCPHKRIA
jgi:hypothetical protein